MTEPNEDQSRRNERIIRSRQRSRAVATAIVLGALVILFYAIAIAKMTGGG